jgi:hypothetical protein
MEFRDEKIGQFLVSALLPTELSNTAELLRMMVYHQRSVITDRSVRSGAEEVDRVGTFSVVKSLIEFRAML